MKRKRIIGIFLISFLVLFVFILSSSIFKLKQVEVVFFNKGKVVQSPQDNFVYNTSSKIQQIVSSGNFEYGSSIFVQNKKFYSSKLEKHNSYLKVEKILSVFPNKIIVEASERTPFFCIKSTQQAVILDKDFKILSIQNLLSDRQNEFILIDAKTTSGFDVDFFSFLNLSSSIFEEGDFMADNNLIFKMIFKFEEVFSTYFVGFHDRPTEFVSRLQLCETGYNNIDLVIYTSSNYGIKLVLSNIFLKFDYKLAKLLKAFKTLLIDEKIKSTYGTLTIDENLNCSWNKL